MRGSLWLALRDDEIVGVVWPTGGSDVTVGFPGGTMESAVPYTTVVGTATRARYSATGKRSFSERTYGHKRVVNLCHRGEVGER